LPQVPDIALVSLGTTPGLRRSDEAFAQLVRSAGASCQIVPVRIGAAGRLRRHIAVTDLVEALAARRSARGIEARAVVFSTVTAAFLQRPRVPYGVRFDAPAALNRPGAAGAWQRAVEHGALGRASVLMPLTEAAAAATPDGSAPVVSVPIPVDHVEPAPERDIDAVAYAGYPKKRRPDLVCAAWARSKPAGGRLVIGGADRDKGLRWLDRCAVPEPEGVEWAGELPRGEWLRTVARARAFVNASDWEDYGVAQFEALAAGTPLVTLPSPGPYEALKLARQLAPELVSDRLDEALAAALAMDDVARASYRGRAVGLLVPYREESIRAVVAERVLPALGVACES
jgi:glycosyltransferase involved in cell wall biosynthesis